MNQNSKLRKLNHLKGSLKRLNQEYDKISDEIAETIQRDKDLFKVYRSKNENLY